MLDYGLIVNFHPWFKLEMPAANFHPWFKAEMLAQSLGAVFVCVCVCVLIMK